MSEDTSAYWNTVSELNHLIEDQLVRARNTKDLIKHIYIVQLVSKSSKAEERLGSYSPATYQARFSPSIVVLFPGTLFKCRREIRCMYVFQSLGNRRVPLRQTLQCT